MMSIPTNMDGYHFYIAEPNFPFQLSRSRRRRSSHGVIRSRRRQRRSVEIVQVVQGNPIDVDQLVEGTFIDFYSSVHQPGGL